MPGCLQTIYDFGANDGCDVNYYLRKANLVVLVEANPWACSNLQAKFDEYIKEGKVVVVNAVVTVSDCSQIPFYVHKYKPALSRLDIRDADPREYNAVNVRARSAFDIISEYGHPHYVKIDVEGQDENILSSLFSNDIYPDYVSIEIHTLSAVNMLLSCDRYTGYKLVEGFSVFFKYGLCRVFSYQLNRRVWFSFPYDSAGPFGDDISGRWLDRASALFSIASYGLGWRDLHASKLSKGAHLSLIQKSYLVIEPVLLKLMSRSYKFTLRILDRLNLLSNPWA